MDDHSTRKAIVGEEIGLDFEPEDIHTCVSNETEEEFDARIEEYVEIEEHEAGLINAIEEERDEEKQPLKLFVVPYMLWIALFVLAPLVLIFGQSFFNIEGQFSLENYKSYFASQNLTYLK